jgi:hypothetical protein
MYRRTLREGEQYENTCGCFRKNIAERVPFIVSPSTAALPHLKRPFAGRLFIVAVKMPTKERDNFTGSDWE